MRNTATCAVSIDMSITVDLMVQDHERLVTPTGGSPLHLPLLPLDLWVRERMGVGGANTGTHQLPALVRAWLAIAVSMLLASAQRCSSFYKMMILSVSLTLGRRVTVVVLSFVLSVHRATENSIHFFVPVKV